MTPLITTAAPFGPQWLPGDVDMPVTWDECVQRALNCVGAGAQVLPNHQSTSATAKGSVDFDP